jgi:hypothetical protein
MEEAHAMVDRDLLGDAGVGAIAGTCRQRLTLTSGRFAMIDNGLGIALVPWAPAIESDLGRHVVGGSRVGQSGLGWQSGACCIEITTPQHGEEVALWDDARALTVGEAFRGEMFGSRL